MFFFFLHNRHIAQNIFKTFDKSKVLLVMRHKLIELITNIVYTNQSVGVSPGSTLKTWLLCLYPLK